MSSGLSPISCESCRQKKCKCDRTLPICKKCTSDPSRCHYPESGKRGLPLGYITQLEARLEETEAALYAALSRLDSMKPSFLPDKPTQMQRNSGSTTKAARMDEWKRLPMSTERTDLMRWYEEKACGSAIANTDLGHESFRVYERRIGHDALNNRQKTHGSVGLGDKAEELVKAEPTIYF